MITKGTWVNEKASGMKEKALAFHIVTNPSKSFLVQNWKSQLLTIKWGTLLVLSIGGTFRLPRKLYKRKYSASKRIFLDVFLQLRIEKSSLVSSCSNLSSSWREIEETNQRFQINQWGKQKRSQRGRRSSRVIYGAAQRIGSGRYQDFETRCK